MEIWRWNFSDSSSQTERGDRESNGVRSYIPRSTLFCLRRWTEVLRNGAWSRIYHAWIIGIHGSLSFCCCERGKICARIMVHHGICDSLISKAYLWPALKATKPSERVWSHPGCIYSHSAFNFQCITEKACVLCLSSWFNDLYDKTF